MMKTTKCKYQPYIDDYILSCRSGETLVGKEILQALDQVERTLNQWDVFIDAEKIDKAVELIERYWKIELFDWELFIISLIHCYYRTSDTVVFDEIALFMGRGNGKNGFISCLIWYLTTHYHGVSEYNVDIVANSEDQAKTSFEDVHNLLERWKSKLSKFFKWNLKTIVNKKTNSYIKFNTSSSGTKDSKRSACLVFDELHEYENYDRINVYVSSFGKKKHSRIFKISTFGHKREGVMDEEVRVAEDILRDDSYVGGSIYFMYRLEKEQQALDPKNWHMSNPSLKYLPVLMQEMTKAFEKMKRQPQLAADFYTKRMNIPRGDNEIQVTEWKFIKATNKPVPDMYGRQAVVGLDYTKVNDMASVDIHFRDGDDRFDLTHSWLCLQSADIPRLKIPWEHWAQIGKLTLVDDVEIHPELITEYIAEQMQRYNLIKLAMDNYRYTLMSDALKKIGFDAKIFKNVKLVRPSDIMKIVPVIDSCFVNEYYHWGDEPLLRWATNNTKLIRSGKRQGTDTGNYYYGKIEGKSRKTDPFMAHVAAMTIEDEIIQVSGSSMPDIGVYTY